MALDEQAEIPDALQQLPPDAEQLTLRCPLCGALAPARGIMARPTSIQGDPSGSRWELAFVCAACGLFTTFAIDHLKIQQIAHLAGSPWAAELREFMNVDVTQTSEIVITPTPNVAHFATTFTACAVMWLLLTGSFARVDLLWGLVVCTGVAALTYRFVAFGAPRWMLQPRKWAAFFLLAVEFTKQIVVQNFTLAWRVFSPNIPIKPGVVAVPFNVRSDVQITILSSLMTLTPDTVVLDIDQSKGMMLIHWIDVKTTQPDEAYQLLVRDLEQKLMAWLD